MRALRLVLIHKISDKNYNKIKKGDVLAFQQDNVMIVHRVINIVEDNDPSSSECKESYDKLYKKLEDKFGSPSILFTPEQNGYTGATWSNTNCGEIWLAWGDKIFGSEEADCILSFSVKGE